MLIKRCLIFFLVLGHIWVNGVAASIHSTEDYQHKHDVEHYHFFDSDKVVSHDEWNHDHDDCTHNHMQFQLSESVSLQLQAKLLPHDDELDWQFSSTAFSPPVPPPTH